ncbi:MAG: hypothetical protein ACTSUE_06065, partial [Promethearchaeota archaeon]
LVHSKLAEMVKHQHKQHDRGVVPWKNGIYKVGEINLESEPRVLAEDAPENHILKGTEVTFKIYGTNVGILVYDTYYVVMKLRDNELYLIVDDKLMGDTEPYLVAAVIVSKHRDMFTYDVVFQGENIWAGSIGVRNENVQDQQFESKVGMTWTTGVATYFDDSNKKREPGASYDRFKHNPLIRTGLQVPIVEEGSTHTEVYKSFKHDAELSNNNANSSSNKDAMMAYTNSLL